MPTGVHTYPFEVFRGNEHIAYAYTFLNAMRRAKDVKGGVRQRKLDGQWVTLWEDARSVKAREEGLNK
jgi:hypothetical protein